MAATEKAAKAQELEEGKQASKEEAAAAAEDAAEAKKHEDLLNSWHEHAQKTHVHVDLETYASALPGKWLTQTGSSMGESDSDSDSDEE